MKTSKIIIISASVIVLVGIAIFLYFVFGSGAQNNLVSVQVKASNITEKTNLLGQVKASQGVDMSFESQGKIVANYVKVGDKIYSGQPLVAIDSSILRSQLKQAEAQLDILSVDTVKSKTNSSLQATYAGSLSASQKSVSTAKGILLTISDIQFAHFAGQTQENLPLQAGKAKAVSSMLGQADSGLWTSQAISNLNGGAFGLVNSAINNPTQDNVDAALSATQSALYDVSAMINAVPIDVALTATERASINSVQTSINSEIMATSANIQAIANLKVNNTATVSTASAQVEAAKANIDAIKTQISKTVIVALFNGQVDKDNVVVGQLVSPNMPVITISNDNLEIDTSVSEIDLPSAKVGGTADITLDAYGNGVNFPAMIFSVDNAPTILNGVSVYGARLKFKDLDSRIKPGMTANITMLSDTHTNVLVVPKSAVIQNNGKFFVLVDNGTTKKETRQVNIGLHDDSNIEIVLGLTIGEKVFAY